MRTSVRIKSVAILMLAVLCVGTWYAVYREDRRALMTVSFLDVGQGDAMFIDAPSGRQVLIDGGRSGGIVLRQLAQVMPFWDRSLDVLIATHPDADHIGGLVDVLERYRVGLVLRSSVRGDTKTFSAFTSAVAEENAQVVTAMRGQVIELGDGAYLEVLFPDRAVPRVDTNDGCVVVRLVYGDTAFMFSCDAPQGVETYLVALASPHGTGDASLRANVLKAGHHGSKTSSALAFLGHVQPSVGVFSRGCDNSYGHPAQETLARFARLEIPTRDTCTQGRVTFVSDGERVY